MVRWLKQWLSSQQGRKRSNRGLALFLAVAFVISLAGLVVSLVQALPRWVAEWQGAHGYYPTGHLTYTVPEQWTTTTLIDIKFPDPNLWWEAFDDQVTTISPSFSACYSQEACAAKPPDGARVALHSAPDQGFTTIEAWYQNWSDVTDSSVGAGTTLPPSDYTPVELGGQTALCAANQEGSQLLPPHPPTSPHFTTTFAGYLPPYENEAAVMCFTLWQGRVYFLEVTVVLHTTSQDSDVHDAAKMIDSLRFT